MLDPKRLDPMRLEATLHALGIQPAPKLFNALVAAYQEPHRRYHNETHVAACLSQLDRFRSKANSVAEIELALWFHDAIYDPRRSDNEELSAVWATEFLEGCGVEQSVCERIHHMILATKSHAASDADSMLLLDIDLGILGTPSSVFERYDRAIREEYAWVPEADYRAGRSKVLQGFLSRPMIYRTLEIREVYEERARANLRAKLQELQNTGALQ